MKFSIITPTYKRPEELLRAVNSVLVQNYTNWEMIIINDSPDFDYSSIENTTILKDERIKYIKNEYNQGVNYSRNLALKNISLNSNYFIFLDDDDWLNENCLTKAIEIIEQNKDFDWFVSNRNDIKNNKSLTKNNLNKNKINYLKNSLVFKRFTGDPTHIISTKYKNKKFSESIKNAEEWIFFAQLSKRFLYYNFNSTYTNGYQNLGITNNYKSKLKKLQNTYKLFKETLKYKLFLYWILIYFILRIGAILFR